MCYALFVSAFNYHHYHHYSQRTLLTILQYMTWGLRLKTGNAVFYLQYLSKTLWVTLLVLQMFKKKKTLQCPTMSFTTELLQKKNHTSSYTYLNALEPLPSFFVNVGNHASLAVCLTRVVDVVKQSWCWMNCVWFLFLFLNGSQVLKTLTIQLRKNKTNYHLCV